MVDVPIPDELRAAVQPLPHGVPGGRAAPLGGKAFRALPGPQHGVFVNAVYPVAAGADIEGIVQAVQLQQRAGILAARRRRADGLPGGGGLRLLLVKAQQRAAALPRDDGGGTGGPLLLPQLDGKVHRVHSQFFADVHQIPGIGLAVFQDGIGHKGPLQYRVQRLLGAFAGPGKIVKLKDVCLVEKIAGVHKIFHRLAGGLMIAGVIQRVVGGVPVGSIAAAGRDEIGLGVFGLPVNDIAPGVVAVGFQNDQGNKFPFRMQQVQPGQGNRIILGKAGLHQGIAVFGGFPGKRLLLAANAHRKRDRKPGCQQGTGQYQNRNSGFFAHQNFPPFPSDQNHGYIIPYICPFVCPFSEILKKFL